MSTVRTDIRDAGMLIVACAAASLFVPGAPLLGVPLVTLAAALLSYRFGEPTAWAAVAAGALALFVVYGPVFAAPAVATIALVGPIAARIAGRRPWRVFGLVLATVVALTVVTLWFDAMASGQSLVSYVADQTREASVLGRELFSQSAPADEVEEQMRIVRTAALEMLPSWVVVIAGLTAWFAVRTLSWAGTRAGRRVEPLPALPDLDVSWHVVWPLIVALALLTAWRVTEGEYAWTYTVGLNLLVLARVALWLQGLAVFGWLYRKAGFGSVGRGFGYVLLTFAEPAFPIAGLTGLADLWVNIRKMPREIDGQSRPEADEGAADASHEATAHDLDAPEDDLKEKL